MLSDEVIDKVTERLVRRIENLNTSILKSVAKKIKEIGTITPTNAQQLVKVMQYGGDYDKIVKELAEATNLNVKDIYKIFREVAKEDYSFKEQFYKYRNLKYIKWEDNKILQSQVDAIAKQTADSYANLSKTSAIGYNVLDSEGNVVFKTVNDMYKDTIDKAVLSVAQGKTSFEEEMYSSMRQLASSGLKYVDYDSGRRMRLDSALRMNMKEALKTMHNEQELEQGKKFFSDGVEITVHNNPAPDHAPVQGRQFRNEEFEKLQNGDDAKDINDRVYNLDHDSKNGFRPISTLNCYHEITTIVIGISKPKFSDEELDKIVKESKKEIDIDGKKKNKYECSQIQRRLETEIRKAKDMQIMGKESNNQKLIDKSEKRIDKLLKKYKEVSDKSGLPTKIERLRVDGYKEVKH